MSLRVRGHLLLGPHVHIMLYKHVADQSHYVFFFERLVNFNSKIKHDMNDLYANFKKCLESYSTQSLPPAAVAHSSTITARPR